ncbi:MAG: 50S ribosome-binding GTPase [Propionibacteriaceae bacterium]|nr:50S ribosome-binding GTPase [Propionibacteriaceae bacterium]
MASLAERLDLLEELTRLTEQRVPPELTARSLELAQRAGQRLRLGEQTVVALAGATGSGKSSLTNALAGAEITTVGVRRPTTSETLAISFGASNPELLDWLRIPRRHEVSAPDPGLGQVVLLDLPDHDSVATAHREEVDRLVALVDQFVWVLDPEKYADDAVHAGYLRPLAGHREVVRVVLNKADRLSPADLAECLADLNRLLEADGLAGVPCQATSTRTGAGIEELRQELARIAAHKSAAHARLSADLDQVAAAFAEACRGEVGQVPPRAVAALEAALSAAAGVPEVVQAVHQGMIHRGALATGWPLVSWLRRLRPDPLKRLRLGEAEEQPLPGPVTVRSSLPGRGAIAQARLRTGLREFADEASRGMSSSWTEVAQRAAFSRVEQLPDLLDEALVRTDLGTRRIPAWWRLVRILQWLLIVCVVLGLGWLGINVALAYFGLPPLPTAPIGPEGGLRIPTPTVMSLGGLLLGLLLGAFGRVLIGLGARTAERRARRRLHRAIGQVAESHVVEPLAAELQRLTKAQQLIRKL